MGSFYRKQLEDWLGQIEVRVDTVLDIGGKRLPVKDRVRHWEVNHYSVLDLPEYNIEDAYIGANTLSATWKLLKGTADMVFCLEVFEYLIDPYSAMKVIADLLLVGGTAYVTFPFVYPHHNELEFDALRYTEPGIKRLAESAGLRVTNVWYRRDKSGLLTQFYGADGMRAAKEYPNHDVTGFIVELTK